MAFFDDWRAQLKSVQALTPILAEHLDDMEKLYPLAGERGKQMMFTEYQKATAKIQAERERTYTTTTYTMTTGMFFSALWTRSVEMYPELAVIEDNDTRHTILACSTKYAQDRVLREYLARSVGSESRGAGPSGAF